MPHKTKKSIVLKLRNYFVTGVIVLIPIGFTLYLSKFLINFAESLVPSGLNPNTYLPYVIPGIEIILTIFFITRGINKSKANKNNDLHLSISLVIPLQNKFKVIIESTLKIKTVANKGKVL